MRKWRNIVAREGNFCILECGHQKRTRAREYAICKQCEAEGFYSISSLDADYVYKTTKTDHEKCMENLAAKCRWESMTRTGVLIHYPNVICKECQDKIGMKKVRDKVRP